MVKILYLCTRKGKIINAKYFPTSVAPNSSTYFGVERRGLCITIK